MPIIECKIRDGEEQRTHGNYVVMEEGMRVVAFALKADAEWFLNPFRFDPSKVEIMMDVEPEDLPVRGNAMASGDAAYDAQCEREIIERLDAGDLWAWCTVTVRANYEGIPQIAGTDYLGCCSYRDEEDFKAGGYWDDMRETATHELREMLQLAVLILCGREMSE